VLIMAELVMACARLSQEQPAGLVVGLQRLLMLATAITAAAAAAAAAPLVGDDVAGDAAESLGFQPHARVQTAIQAGRPLKAVRR